MIYKYQYLQHFCWVSFERWPTVTLIIIGLVDFRLGSIDYEIRQISSIFFTSRFTRQIVWLNELFQSTVQFENSISHSIEPSFKICILLCSCNACTWSRIYTYLSWYWRNSCRSDHLGRGRSGKSIAVSCGYWNRSLIVHRRKSEWYYEFNELNDQNIKVYLSLLKNIALLLVIYLQ